MKIKIFDISHNLLQTVNISIQHTQDLQFLNFSHNRIQKLSENNMHDLDAVTSSREIKIDLSGNTMLCTCETLHFLQWMTETNVILLNIDSYKCSYGNGTVTTLHQLSFIVKHLELQCSSETILIASVSVLIVCSLTVIGLAILYRYRWRIRYWYYKRKFKAAYTTTDQGYEQMFEYDVFISYSSDDYEIARHSTMEELESKRGLRACIHERDFQPGEYIAQNISRAINSSRRTILFVSNNFLGSEWCQYELNIALMEEMNSERKVVMAVMIDDIPNKSLSVDLRHIIHAYTYLEYPKNTTDSNLNVFWNKCAEFIKEG
ncbi:Hypothetical predicted protein [Mytilus galloprovincialis]|uniref:TIR domain-containing protein n=1 Tax=Mytilus galloprovincialis TaxID=29158 RepID=A0A8B6DNM2_MYTGA|nr:Hypothetical predicted protein [Mytilus galloprovincialis]